MLLVRDIFTPTFTLGRLYDGDDVVGFTCEDVVRGNGNSLTVEDWKIPKVTAIPYGVYSFGISYSNRFKRELPQVYNVPGFEGIRFHGGNTAADSEGCILLGLTRTKTGVANCAPAIEDLLQRLGSGMTTLRVMKV